MTRRLRGAVSGESEDWFQPNLSAEAASWVAHIVALAERSKGGRQDVASAVVDGVLLDEIETAHVVELGPELVVLKVELKKITDPDDENSRLVLCRSAQRRLQTRRLRSTKAELSSFFRKEGHRNYRKCPEQVLRKFIQGLSTKPE